MRTIELPINEKIAIVWQYPTGGNHRVVFDSDIWRLGRIKKLGGTDPLDILGDYAVKRKTGTVSIEFDCGKTVCIRTMEENNHESI